MKRFVSVLLIFCMVLSTLPSEVLAADMVDGASADVVEQQECETEQDHESEEQESAIPEDSDGREETAAPEEPSVSEEPTAPEGASESGGPSEMEAVSFPEGTIGCEGDDIPHSATYEPEEDSIDPDQLAAMCPVPYAAGEMVRYSVLVLDTSASSSFEENGRVFYTADTAIEYVRESAKKFVSDVRKADGINYVAVVEYKNAVSNIVSGFTTDYDTLNETIDGLYSSGNVRSVAYGLQKVNSLLDAIPDSDAIKNVVLFTTGMTNEGPYSYSGKFNENTIASNWRRMDTQVRLYAYSNSAIVEAETLKNKASLYTVGLFQVMEDMPQAGREVVEFFKLFTKDMATSEDYFYDVKDPSQLEFVFGEIADSIMKGSGKFKYAGQINQKRDQEAIYFYDDGYFFKNATDYDRSLSTMSLCLELSTWSSSSVLTC